LVFRIGKYLYIGFWILLFQISTIQNSFSQAKRYSFSEQKMGSDFTIIFYHNDSTIATNISRNAFQIVDTLNNSFSDYRVDSEISMLAKNATNNKWIPVSTQLFDILKISKRAWQLSDGAFDVTIGQLTKLWRKSKKVKILSNKNILEKALKTKCMPFIAFNDKAKSIKLLKKGTEFDLGGIGKGYAAQKVFEYLKSENIQSALVDAAGNMAIGNSPPDKLGWKVGLQLPNELNTVLPEMMTIENMAISTSGDVYKNIEIGNKRYSHILNPKTGLGLTNQKQVTIICKNATTADWLSTSCCILSNKKALLLAKKMNAEIIIFETKNNKLIETKSSGFKQYIKH
jgi:FAD:protein FMN transferase